MEISKAAVGFLVAICITAGAGGAYFATRHAEPSAASQPDTALVGSETAPSAAVEQSEVVLAEAPEAEATPAVSAPTPTRRAAIAPPPRPAREERATSSADRPSRPATATADTPAVVADDRSVAPALVEPPHITDNQPSRYVAPPGPQFEELVVAADSVIGLELESTLTSERARVEDPVAARVTRDVKVGDRVAIPAGSRAQGEVTLVERGGRLRDRARLGVRFTSIVLADGTRLPLQTETIYRDGETPSGESAAKIGGGAIGGAILGGILGGAKGAAIGGSVGAGAGSAAVLAGGRNPATLSSGSPVTVRMEHPVTVTVEK